MPHNLTRDWVDPLVALLTQAAQAHAEYERVALSGQPDADWPGWYATYLTAHGLEALIAGPHAHEIHARLAEILGQADRLHRAEGPDAPWPPFYARYLLSLE